jgi:hypothetical protein
MTKRARYIVGFTVLCVAVAFLWPARPQPLCYHDFADDRTMFGVPNFLDVASNAAFLIPGIVGLVVVARRRTQFASDGERWPYAAFFAGVLLTAVGSAYYHLAPDNERLFWDRLPITVALMSLVAAQIVDRISVRAGLALLVPLLAVGVASVVWWLATERSGAGNVVPYVVLQVYSVAILVVIAWLYPSRYTRGSDIYWVFAWYVAAKAFEYFDDEIFALGNIVSGHTLKHLAAAAAALVVCRTLLRRTPLSEAGDSARPTRST